VANLTAKQSIPREAKDFIPDWHDFIKSAYEMASMMAYLYLFKRFVLGNEIENSTEVTVEVTEVSDGD
jgi:hypothetical protein